MEILEVLKSVVADPAAPSTEKNRAAAILAYIARTEKRLAQLPEIDRVVAQKLARIIGRERSLWEHPNHYEIYTDGDGVERIRQKGDCEELPSVIPIKQVTLKENNPEPEQVEESKPLSGPEKLAAAKELTRGLLPSLNF